MWYCYCYGNFKTKRHWLDVVQHVGMSSGMEFQFPNIYIIRKKPPFYHPSTMWGALHCLYTNITYNIQHGCQNKFNQLAWSLMTIWLLRILNCKNVGVAHAYWAKVTLYNSQKHWMSMHGTVLQQPKKLSVSVMTALGRLNQGTFNHIWWCVLVH